jgi:hypothetical protein
MQQAQGALDAALAAGADKYATEEFGAAQHALANARDAVTQRDYRLALDRALDSRERAQNAAKAAADGKAAARVDADHALAAAETGLHEIDAKLKAIETGKNKPARPLSGPRKSVDTAQKSVQEARAAFDRFDYLEAAAEAKTATASLPAILTEIDAATTPQARKHR